MYYSSFACVGVPPGAAWTERGKGHQGYRQLSNDDNKNQKKQLAQAPADWTPPRTHVDQSKSQRQTQKQSKAKQTAASGDAKRLSGKWNMTPVRSFQSFDLLAVLVRAGGWPRAMLLWFVVGTWTRLLVHIHFGWIIDYCMYRTSLALEKPP